MGELQIGDKVQTGKWIFMKGKLELKQKESYEKMKQETQSRMEYS